MITGFVSVKSSREFPRSNKARLRCEDFKSFWWQGKGPWAQLLRVCRKVQAHVATRVRILVNELLASIQGLTSPARLLAYKAWTGFLRSHGCLGVSLEGVWSRLAYSCSKSVCLCAFEGLTAASRTATSTGTPSPIPLSSRAFHPLSHFVVRGWEGVWRRT